MSQFIDEILHELKYYNNKNDAREEWITYMVSYYMNLWPGNSCRIYRKWAESYVDTAAGSLGDYFSRSHYETD